jgi:hypothetical protein
MKREMDRCHSNFFGSFDGERRGDLSRFRRRGRCEDWIRLDGNHNRMGIL